MRRHPIPPDHITYMARRGDPSAFYALFSQQAHEAYAEARDADLDHPKAVVTVLSFMRRVYHAFTGKLVEEPLDGWYEEYKRHCFHVKVSELTLEQQSTEEERANFDAQLQMMLQREYCELRKSDEGFEGVLHVRRYMLLHPVMRLPIYTALILGIVATGFLYLNLSFSQMSVTLASPYQRNSIYFKSTAGKFFEVWTSRADPLQDGIANFRRRARTPPVRPTEATASTAAIPGTQSDNADSVLSRRRVSSPRVQSPVHRAAVPATHAARSPSTSSTTLEAPAPAVTEPPAGIDSAAVR